MKLVALVLVVLAVPLGAFAYWGVATKAGQRRFDEMDGIYPTLAGLVAAILLVLGALVWGVTHWMRSRGQSAA
jgi:heme/copper-type cytochrome/quinol oxidase subunit 2